MKTALLPLPTGLTCSLGLLSLLCMDTAVAMAVHKLEHGFSSGIRDLWWTSYKAGYFLSGI